MSDNADEQAKALYDKWVREGHSYFAFIEVIAAVLREAEDKGRADFFSEHDDISVVVSQQHNGKIVNISWRALKAALKRAERGKGKP